MTFLLLQLRLCLCYGFGFSFEFPWTWNDAYAHGSWTEIDCVFVSCPCLCRDLVLHPLRRSKQSFLRSLLHQPLKMLSLLPNNYHKVDHTQSQSHHSGTIFRH